MEELILETGKIRKADNIIDKIAGIFDGRTHLFPMPFDFREQSYIMIEIKELKTFLQEKIKDSAEYDVILRLK